MVRKEVSEKLKAVIEIYPVKRLQKFGGSYAFIVPKEWVEFCCDEVEGSYWLEVIFDGRRLVARSLSKKELEGMLATLKEKEVK